MSISVDIRRSTVMLGKSTNQLFYLTAITTFVDTSWQALRDHGFWFDKFEGDGFLAHVPIWNSPRDGAVPLNQALRILAELLWIFKTKTMPLIAQLVPDPPSDAGLAIGLDGGESHMFPVAGAITWVGDPVVGAVRMQSAAEAWEIVATPRVGDVIEANGSLPDVLSAEKTTRKTKEYPQGTSVSVFRLLPRVLFE
jgi:class 3 adenylate cyclase